MDENFPLGGTCPSDRLGGIIKPQAEVYIRESETIDRLTVDIAPISVSAVWVMSVMSPMVGSNGSKGTSTHCMSWMHCHTHGSISSSSIVMLCLWCEVK